MGGLRAALAAAAAVALAAPGGALAYGEDPPAVRRRGEAFMFRDLAIAGPRRVPGCEEGRIASTDPVDGYVSYRCAHGVTLFLWTRRNGWDGAEDAFANAFALLPGRGRRWTRTAQTRRLVLPAANAPAGTGAQETFLSRSAEFRGARSARTPTRRWLVQDTAAPRLVVGHDRADPRAAAEAERGLRALVAAMRLSRLPAPASASRQ